MGRASSVNMPNVARFPFWYVVALVLGTGLVAWIYAPRPKPPGVEIRSVKVEPHYVEKGGTVLRMTTRYDNDGCDQIILARFLINSMPSPPIVLPQMQGPTVLPKDRHEITEEVPLAFDLTKGQWHLFSVASCYLEHEASATVSPTALFEIHD